MVSVTARTVRSMFVPVSPSGTGKDIEIVQTGAVAVERSLRGPDELENRGALGHRPVISRSERFFDFAGFEAPGADVRSLGAAVQEDADSLEVWIEASPRCHHRMAPVVSERRLLPTDSADSGHDRGSLAKGVGCDAAVS